MSPAAVPHPDYLITLVGPGSGAGAGVPGAAVRDAATGRVIDRVPGRKDMYSAVAATASNHLFFLAARSARERAAGRGPDAGQTAPGGAFRLASVCGVAGPVLFTGLRGAFRPGLFPENAPRKHRRPGRGTSSVTGDPTRLSCLRSSPSLKLKSANAAGNRRR